MRARVFVLTAVLLAGGACTSGGLEGVSSDKRPGEPSSEVVNHIPPPGAAPKNAPPPLPDRGANMPTDTISLEELHRQGRTDVVR